MRHFVIAFAMCLLPISIMAQPSNSAQKEIVAVCGDSDGQAFFFEGGIVKPGSGGWMPDKISKGMIFLVKVSDKDYDIVINTQENITLSYTADGMAVIPVKINISDNTYLVSAIGNGVVETYLFKLNSKKFGSVSWTASKTTDYITKTSLMNAQCFPLEFWTEQGAKDKKR